MSEWFESQKKPNGDFHKLLREILLYDSHLHIWFDRDIRFEIGGDVNADIISFSRLVASRSNSHC